MITVRFSLGVDAAEAFGETSGGTGWLSESPTAVAGARKMSIMS